MSALYHGIVTHTRLRPARHHLRYRLFSLLLDLDTLAHEAAALRLFSHNRFNLFSFHDRDHGDGGASPAAWARAQMQAAGLATAGSRILLLTMPRLLGYAFNPLSVYFCHTADGALAAILYEVNNTFGQRHSYFLPVPGQSGGVVRHGCDKNFYVSPFMDMDLHYDFTLQPPAETVRLRIAVRDAKGVMLTAALSGRRDALRDGTLLRAAFTYPLLTLKVMAGIHWEAARLWLKGLRLRPRPAAPEQAVSFPQTPGRAV